MKGKRIFSFFLYAAFGITTEVFFTAIVDLINSGTLDNLSLKGYTYIWMFPIYGSISIAFPLGYAKLKEWNFLLRYLTYAVVILIVEFISGFLLEQITGTCPWKYTEGWHIAGYIRLDYLPLWMVFGAMVEKFHRYVVGAFRGTSL